MPRGSRAVALQQDLERRMAVDLQRAVRRQLGEPPLVAAAEEVRLRDRGQAGLEHIAHEQEDEWVDGAAERLRPLDVPDAERVEQRLLDLVLLDQRQLEP